MTKPTIIGDATPVNGRWICENCGERFDRDKSGQRPIRFCKHSCYVAWRKRAGVTTGQFQKQNEPWNKNKKGIHLSPKTEFRKGRKALNKLPVGSITIRIRSRDKTPRAWIKTAEPNTWRERAYERASA